MVTAELSRFTGQFRLRQNGQFKAMVTAELSRFTGHFRRRFWSIFGSDMCFEIFTPFINKRATSQIRFAFQPAVGVIKLWVWVQKVSKKRAVLQRVCVPASY